MSIRSHRPARRVSGAGLAAVVLAGSLLSGCGVSDQELRPGVAAQVGDTSVSLSEVDDAVDVACGFFVDQGQAGFPRALARQQFVTVLVQRAAASQALDDEGLAIGDDYAQTAGGLDAANAQIPEDQRGAFVLLSEATTYIDSAASVLGEAAFSADGDVPADPALVAERGRSEIAGWISEHDVSINPVFRLTVDGDGQVVNDDTGTSVAVSDLAVQSVLDPATATAEQAQGVANQLPPSQLCGA